jgi:hypothetical protein
MEDCIQNKGRALWVDDDAFQTIECTQHFRTTHDQVHKSFIEKFVVVVSNAQVRERSEKFSRVSNLLQEIRSEFQQHNDTNHQVHEEGKIQLGWQSQAKFLNHQREAMHSTCSCFTWL